MLFFEMIGKVNQNKSNEPLGAKQFIITTGATINQVSGRHTDQNNSLL
jgi:hypothetical protein